MKVYLVKAKGTATHPFNMRYWGDVDKDGNSIYVRTVHAFLHKREAVKFVKALHNSNPSENYELEVVAFESN